MPALALQDLKPHPAQMRTTYDLEALATLTLQVATRGLDHWQPVVVAPNGRGRPDDPATYHIISGHRRHMAQLLALALPEQEAEPATRDITDVTMEQVRTLLHTLVETHGSLDAAVAHLLAQYGRAEIPVVFFEGDAKAEILALHAANYGSEKPDVLGVAHSFRQALEAGATPQEIARNSGQHVHFVHNHLALTKIPAALAQRIAAGELPMSVATAVADLPEPKRSGLAIFLLANPSTSSGQATGSRQVGTLTAKAIKECAATLKKWPGLQMPLMVKHPSQRNIARALVRLWSQGVEAYPEDAYAAAAMLIYREVHQDPWANQEKLTLWFQALGGDTYFTAGAPGTSQGGIHWPAVVEHLLTEVSCQTCPIAQLPAQLLRSDLSQGQGGPLGMPCRVGQAANRCIHGLAPNDSFEVRVPWAWSQHPGVVGEGGDYRVKSYEDLLAAWQAQLEKERAEDAAAVATSDAESETTVMTPTMPPTLSQQTASPDPHQEADGRSSPTPPAKDSPIVKQRAQIAAFMKQHEQLAATHPFATPCRRCRHRLDGSPTQDEAVPHCAWAGRLRSVSFQVLEPQGESQAPHIPVCRQFAPDQPWHERIPAHPSPPEMPREWLKEQILHLVGDANRHSNSNGNRRNAFEFLTGRPMGSNENYSDWFAQQLDTQGGDLSDAQLFTLFVWAHTEWQRIRHGLLSLPVNGKSVQFATYHERPWRTEEAT